ncbi:MAG: hypothetical protein A2297_07665 [Elusimicrobia bacterium RIFOXYB2_FULL_48_7]|nr:MAG: hypothetical protein A2297_07665 [Elusimicrobia bacterium RIFOXYB2_FULL_48_7]
MTEINLSCIPIIIGAAIMLFSIVRFRKIFAVMDLVPAANRRNVSLFLKTHIILMVFFLAGYMAVGYAFCSGLHIISEPLVGLIFLFGAVFVLLGVFIQDVLIGQVRKHVSAVNQVEKMVALGQLASGVAHELNNPLTVILGFAQAIKKETAGNKPLEESAAKIEREAKRSMELVRDLLVFSRREKIETEEIDLNKAIDSALALIQPRLKMKNIELAKSFGDLPGFNANRNKIQQLVINLCNNAVDASANGDKLMISTKYAGGFLELRISDTGPGIPEEIKKHIFEPFYTTKEEGKGTGLGLSLCYEIVKKHNGTIEVYSELNKGTVFTIKFPGKNPPPAAS